MQASLGNQNEYFGTEYIASTKKQTFTHITWSYQSSQMSHVHLKQDLLQDSAQVSLCVKSQTQSSNISIPHTQTHTNKKNINEHDLHVGSLHNNIKQVYT